MRLYEKLKTVVILKIINHFLKNNNLFTLVSNYYVENIKITTFLCCKKSPVT